MKRHERRIEEKNYLVIIMKIFTDIAVVVGIAIFLVSYFFGSVKVVGTSMEPTFSDKDKLLIDRFSYIFSEVKRFDIIAYTLEGSDTVYVKRVIGLPGEKVKIENGKIYIDGKLLDNDIEAEAILNAGTAADSVKLDENEYFVLGDNRNNSEDSRFETIGNVTKDNILGKVWFEATGTSDFGFVSKEE